MLAHRREFIIRILDRRERVSSGGGEHPIGEFLIFSDSVILERAYPKDAHRVILNHVVSELLRLD